MKKRRILKISILSNEVIQRYGEGASQIIQVYKGERYDGLGNKLEYKGRCFRKIALSKVNSKYEYSNLKQQAGFVAELIKESRDNKEAIISGSTERTTTTDGIGLTNNTKFDHVKLDKNGNIIKNSGSQMKVKGHYNTIKEIKISARNIVDDINSKKWEKYLDAPIDLPSEQIKYVLNEIDGRIGKLEIQIKNLKEKGQFEKVTFKQKQLEKYKKIKVNVRDSGVKSAEAMEARLNPKRFVTKEVLKDCHNGGKQAAKGAFMLSGILSVASNIYAVVKGEKDCDQAAMDFAKDTTVSIAMGYGIGFTGTSLKAMMHSSSNKYLRSIGKTSAPAMIITGVTETGKILYDYIKGNINEREVFERMGERGTGMVAASYGMYLGTAVMPGIGTIAGGMLGVTINGILYESCLQVLKERDISYERKLVIEEMCREAESRLKTERIEFESRSLKIINSKKTSIEILIKNIYECSESGSVDDVLKNINELAECFNMELEFKDFGEVDNFMKDEKKKFIF